MPSTPLPFGWLPDLPDHRDYPYRAPRAVLTSLPSQVDLRPQCPPVVDQGNLGSCVANAIANAHLYAQTAQHKKTPFLPSRLFLYFGARLLEGTTRYDSGAYIRDGFKVLAQKGACPEGLWPYDISKFTRAPTRQCYAAAAKYQAIAYFRLTPTLGQLKGCLAEGFPFVFGFAVYSSFDTVDVARTGVVPLPTVDEEQLGGHAVLAVGYDDRSTSFLVQNSWGTRWGMHGYFTLPYGYLVNKNLADDFWTLRVVEI